ncbi:MAG: response regulator [Gammaproteobacteria bacterium]|nr:response regulator [Gammaproteobacteria bacterium]
MTISEHTPEILLVDDEELLIEILKDYLEDEPYNLSTASDGQIAIDMLTSEPEKYDVVLLDRMMPNLDGLSALKQIKAHPELSSIPVILQTAMASKENILEGIDAGAFYYLTKPFEEEYLRRIIATAVKDRLNYLDLLDKTEESKKVLSMMQSGSFQFKTLAEGRLLATKLSSACKDPNKVVLGLSELIINAVEHGNAGVTYDEKTDLVNDGMWENTVNDRISSAENANKFVKIDFKRYGQSATFVITDFGDGFDWQEYMQMSPERGAHNHGRGIAMANMFSFSKVEYQGKGNIVKVVVGDELDID